MYVNINRCIDQMHRERLQPGGRGEMSGGLRTAERVAAQPGQNQANLRPVNHDLPISTIHFIYF